MAEATGLENRILMTKNPADFRTRQVRVRRNSDTVFVEPEGPGIDFDTMNVYRHQPKSFDEVQAGFAGEGVLLANIGVSNSIRLFHQGKEYQVLVRQVRKDAGFDDVVAKLVSGYITGQGFEDPVGAGLAEVAEEFLPFTWAGNVVAGLRNGKPLPRTFDPILPYDERVTYVLHDRAPAGHATDHRRVVMSGTELPDNARVFYAPGTNSAQLVFHYTIDIDLEQLADIKHAEAQQKIAHILHAEESLVKEEKEGRAVKKVITYLGKQPLYLARIDNNRLTGQIYNFKDGRMVSLVPDLSEAFAPSQSDGIIFEKNISLKNYHARK